MLPPLLSDRSHRSIHLPALRGPALRNHSLEDELFDYNVIAARALKPHRVPLCNMQLPMDGSLLTPQAYFVHQPAIYDNYTPLTDRKLITELRRPVHIKNTHRPIMNNPNQLYFPQPPVNTPRAEYPQPRSRPMAEEYYEASGYPTLLTEQLNRNVELERRKINNLIGSKHNRTQSNVLVSSQSTKNLPINLTTEPVYSSEDLPKHIASLEKYNITLKKEIKTKTTSENTKPQVSAETSPIKNRKTKPVEEKSKKEEEPSPSPKPKTEDKKHVTHHKSQGDDMRKLAILNNAQRKSSSDTKIDE